MMQTNVLGLLRVTRAALPLLAKIVHGADVPEDLGIVPEAAGLQAAAHGFAAICEDDHRKLELEFPLYDALYAWCRHARGETHTWKY